MPRKKSTPKQEQAPVQIDEVLAPALTVIEMIATEQIVPSPFNPRKFDSGDRGIRELARSIGSKGLIEPIHVRFIGDGLYEIIFGERRWRACREIGKAQMECVIRTMTEQEAREAIAIEYFQHEDLTLLEEAAGIQMYLDTGIEPKVVAENLGKPLGWVLKRAKLKDLSPKWKAVMNDPDNPFSSWSVSHLDIIVRFEHAVQDEIMEFFGQGYLDVETISVSRLKSQVSMHLKKLSSAPWPLDTAISGCDAGSCTDCLKRAGAQSVLFEEAQGEVKDDDCLDKECFDRKLNAWLETQVATLRERHGNLALVDNSTWSVSFLPESSSIKSTAIRPVNYETAAENTEGAFPALVVDGPDIGQLRYYRLRPEPEPDTNGSFDSRNRFDEHGNKLPTPLSVRRARLEKRRTIRYIETVMSFLDVKEEKNISAMTGNLDERKVLAAVLAFGAQRQGGFYRDDRALWNAYHARMVGEYDRDHTIRDLLLCVAPIWQKMLYTESKATNPSLDVADQICAFFGWPAETWKEDVKSEIPDPKVWATLNEDGTPKEGINTVEESIKDTTTTPRSSMPDIPVPGEIEDAEFSELEVELMYDREESQEEYGVGFDEFEPIAA